MGSKCPTTYCDIRHCCLLACVSAALVPEALSFHCAPTAFVAHTALPGGADPHNMDFKNMARITSYCGTMRTHDHQMALLTSDCVPPWSAQVIGLTIFAYRYEGLRPSDFTKAIRNLQSKLQVRHQRDDQPCSAHPACHLFGSASFLPPPQDEIGPYKKRPSYAHWNKLVALAGGRVRGVDWKTQNRMAKGYTNDKTLLAEENVVGMSDHDYLLRNVWPLQLVDTNDPEQFDFLYDLMHRCGTKEMIDPV